MFTILNLMIAIVMLSLMIWERPSHGPQGEYDWQQFIMSLRRSSILPGCHRVDEQH